MELRILIIFLLSMCFLTNFSLAATSLIDCSVLSTANEVYELQNNVTSLGTCFNITANNVTLEGNGYIVIYGNDSTGNGVFSNGYNDTTIRNIDLRVENVSRNNSHGIYFGAGTDLNISNVNLTLYGDGGNVDNIGLYLVDLSNSSIENCTINSTSTNDDGYAIFLYASSGKLVHNVDFFNNKVHTYDTDSYGLRVVTNGDLVDLIVDNITINTFGDNSRGISLENSGGSLDNVTIKNSTIKTGGSSANGIWSSGSNITVSFLDINTTDTSSDGILLSSSDDFRIDHTLINTYAALNSDGIQGSGSRLVIVNSTVNVNYDDPSDDSNMFGIYSTGLQGNITDSVIYSKDDWDIYLFSGSFDFYLTNVTISDEEVDVGSSLFRRWYIQVNATDSGGNPLENVNASGTNSSGETQFSVLTGSDGISGKLEIIQYVNESGTTKDYNDYTTTGTLVNYANGVSTDTITGNTMINLTLEGVNPLITLDYPSNDSYFNNGTNIYFNFTAIDSNGTDTCILYGNWSDGWHQNFTWVGNFSGVQNFTTRNLSEGSFIWNVWCNDTVGNESFADNNFTINIDLTDPTLNIESPESQTYVIPTVDFNISLSEQTISFCVVSIDLYTINHTMTKINNTYYNFQNSTMADGNYTASFWCNDSANNVGINSTNFAVDTVPPMVSLEFPTSNQYLANGSLNMNYTPYGQAGVVDTCELYGNWSGWGLKYQNTTATNASTDSVNVSLSDGAYIWNVWCNNTVGTEDWSQQGNITFTIDTVYPQTVLNLITTTLGSQTISFSHNASDINMDICSYSIYNSSGDVDGLNNNVTVTCNASTSATVSSFGTYSLYFHSRDKAGNENSTNSSFNVQDLTLSIGGSGGTVTKISTVALIKPEGVNFAYSDLDRAKLYKVFSVYCVNKTNFIGRCNLDGDGPLLEINELYQISMELEELLLWLEQYNKNEVENVEIPQREVTKWGLIVAMVEFIPIEFASLPSKIDGIFIALDDTWEYDVLLNKVFISGAVINGDLGFSVEKIGDTQAKLKYKIFSYPPEYYFSVEKTKINYVDLDGNSIFQDVTLRVITPKGLFMLVIIGILVIIVSFFIFRKRIKFRWKT